MIAAIAQCLARGMRALRIGWRIERGSVTMNVSPTSTIAEVPDRQRELARLRGNRGIATWTWIGARNSRVSLRFGSNAFDAKRNLDPRTPGSTLAAARLKPVPPDPPDSLLQALLATEKSCDVLVIGAGIVGVAIALRLQQEGQNVLLIDRERVAAQSSRGNAGALAFADILPLASPGILRKAPRWLLDPLGPLAIRPRHLPRLAPWLFRFWRASQRHRVRAGTAAQAALMNLSADETPSMLALAGASDMLRSEGALHLYESEAELEASQPGWQARADHGIASTHLHGAQAIAELQPGLSGALVAATFVPRWRTVSDPLLVTQVLARAFEQRGGRIRRANAAALAPGAEGVSVQLSDGRLLVARRVVVAAGAWSHHLARTLAEHIPLETERGYNTTLPVGAFDLKRQLTFGGHGFVVTPLACGVRVGGAVEFAGLDAPPNYARSAALLAKAKHFMPGLRTEGGTQWMGFRPSLPDSLPAIGPAAADKRVTYAFGHGHLGLTQAAATARLVADIVGGRPPPLDLAPFSPQRFGSARRRTQLRTVARPSE
jgi:D-amino-acid dehydrogenase